MTFGISAGTAAAAVSAAASVGGAVAGAVGSGDAAGASAKQSAEQLAWLRMIAEASKGNLQPYMALGQAGAEGYRAALPGLTQRYTMEDYQKDPLYTPMVRNLAELQATPGYQFQLQQGQQGLEQSAAAKGGLLSGAQGKAMNDYSQNVAATGFQSAWERAQKAYQNAFANNIAQNAQIGNIYQNAANIGQTAATNLGNIAAGVGSASNVPYQDLNVARSAQAASPWSTGATIAGQLPSLMSAGQSIYNQWKTPNNNSQTNGNFNYSG